MKFLYGFLLLFFLRMKLGTFYSNVIYSSVICLPAVSVNLTLSYAVKFNRYGNRAILPFQFSFPLPDDLLLCKYDLSHVTSA